MYNTKLYQLGHHIQYTCLYTIPMYALGHPSIPPSAPGFLQQSFSSSTKSKSLETMYHWLVYCSRCWRCRDTQNLHKNCWLVWDCFDLGRHYCAGAGAAYLRLQVEVHQGEAAAMKVDAKDAKMKQFQEWEKGRRVEVEDEWIRIRPRAANSSREEEMVVGMEEKDKWVKRQNLGSKEPHSLWWGW